MLDHARHFELLYGQRQVHRMRKHLGWYCRAFPRAAALRARMFQVSSVSELETVLADYRAWKIMDSTPTESLDDVSATASRCS
jgi:tRNA-dihydrouridine synthase